jgi:hypothetical protein
VNARRTGAALVVIAAVALFGSPPLGPDEAAADRTTATTIWHSGKTTLSDVNVLITDDIMQRRVCVGWMLENLDSTDTIFLNINNYKNPEPAAVVGSYDDQVVIAPGCWKSIDVHVIKRIQGVSDGTADLYWQAICHIN